MTPPRFRTPPPGADASPGAGIGRRRLLGVAAALTLTGCGRPRQPCLTRPIVIDVGHTPDAPGTISASGVEERDFNRRFASRLAVELRDRLPPDGTVEVIEIRVPDPRHDRRIARIAAADPSLIVSVHHDSVQERYLTHHTVGGAELSQTDATAGFSLFVPTATPVAAASRHVATAVADALLALGERPSLHHAEPIEGENRRLLDVPRGIYAGDFLKLLRTATAPAVLLEVAVIKNPAEERRLSGPATQTALAGAVARAIATSRCPTLTVRPAARSAGSPE